MVFLLVWAKYKWNFASDCAVAMDFVEPASKKQEHALPAD